MKIALIGPTYPFRGGIAHYTTLLYRHLKKPHEVRFFAFERQYPAWLFPGKSDRDPSLAPILEPGAERTIDSMNPATWLKTAREIVRSGCDAVVLPWWVSFWAPQFLTIVAYLKKHSKAKIIFICHNVVAHESKAYDRLLTRWVLNTGDGYLVHSSEDENNLRDMIPGARICRRFHPTYDAFGDSTLDEAICRETLEVKGNVLLFFGFVREYKGLKYLLAAMPEILAEIPVTLLVVGEFWKDKDVYLKMIDEMGLWEQVRIIDQYVPNEDVGRYFCAANLVVQPYVSATGSGVVQMAFGFNKPVLATAVGSLPEIVEDGETGFLVPSGDASAISKAVIRFFREDNALIFEENIRNRQYRFSWEHLVSGLESLLEDD
ncbi:MAG: glycosyltransferase [Desulfobacteraceae bacterium]|nr:MAG: glycosyltransferase [Desulfobacteraceae bacterium]